MSSFEYLHQEEVGKAIQKCSVPPLCDTDIDPKVIRKCSVPPLCDANIDPKFASRKYNEQIDGAYLRKNLNIGSSANDDTRLKVTNLVKKYWCCFVEENVKIPIPNYKCVINTGDHMPLIAHNIRYGLQETPIMQKAIDSLLHNDQICVNTSSPWLS
jgi:hypothetical protein